MAAPLRKRRGAAVGADGCRPITGVARCPARGIMPWRTSGVARPLLPGDGFHAVLELQLLLLERGLFHLLLVAQDDLLGQGEEAGLVLVVLLVQTAVLL